MDIALDMQVTLHMKAIIHNAKVQITDISPIVLQKLQ